MATAWILLGLDIAPPTREVFVGEAPPTHTFSRGPFIDIAPDWLGGLLILLVIRARLDPEHAWRLVWNIAMAIALLAAVDQVLEICLPLRSTNSASYRGVRSGSGITLQTLVFAGCLCTVFAFKAMNRAQRSPAIRTLTGVAAMLPTLAMLIIVPYLFSLIECPKWLLITATLAFYLPPIVLCASAAFLLD